MGYRNISFRHSDGGGGWAEKGPFDAIMVTAAPRTVPEELILQLADNGRMLVPVGEPSQQELFMIRKIDGEILQTSLEPVRFVPLLGGKS
jgi:protein-L-isoaspartate(D-aspartate) O-methyltransferase